MPYKDPERQRQAVIEAKAVRAAKPVAELLGIDDLPDPPGREEILKLLGVKARAGNVPALKLLLELDKSDGDRDSSEKTDPLAAVDELASRRAA